MSWVRRGARAESLSPGSYLMGRSAGALLDTGYDVKLRHAGGPLVWQVGLLSGTRTPFRNNRSSCGPVDPRVNWSIGPYSTSSGRWYSFFIAHITSLLARFGVGAITRRALILGAWPKVCGDGSHNLGMHRVSLPST